MCGKMHSCEGKRHSLEQVLQQMACRSLDKNRVKSHVNHAILSSAGSDAHLPRDDRRVQTPGMQRLMPLILEADAGAHGRCIKLLTDKCPGQENTDTSQTTEDGCGPFGEEPLGFRSRRAG